MTDIRVITGTRCSCGYTGAYWFKHRETSIRWGHNPADHRLVMDTAPLVHPPLPDGPIYNPPRLVSGMGFGCGGLCVRAGDLLEGYGNAVVYPHPRCPKHGDWETDLDIETTAWLNGGMEITVLFENSDYDLYDLEDLFDWYRQADGVSTLDYGLHMVFDEEISWRA